MGQAFNKDGLEKVDENYNLEEDRVEPATNFEQDGTQFSDEPFLVPFWRMPCKQIWKEIGYFFKFGLSMSLNNSANVLVIFINFLYIGAEGDPVLQASFGLGVSYFSFFYFSLCLACYEVTGIQCGKWFGKKDYYKMSVSLVHGFLLMTLVTIFS